MEKKIIKVQLYTLFLLASLNVVYFHFKDQLPDNYFEISYQNDSINIVSYYLFTLVANFGYWCGIWISASLIAFALLNSLYFTNRVDSKSSLVILALLPVNLLTCQLLLPESLGEGLSSLLRDNMDTFTTLVSLLFFSLCLFYLISEKNFFKMSNALFRIFSSLIKQIQVRRLPSATIPKLDLSLLLKHIIKLRSPVPQSNEATQATLRSASVKSNQPPCQTQIENYAPASPANDFEEANDDIEDEIEVDSIHDRALETDVQSEGVETDENEDEPIQTRPAKPGKVEESLFGTDELINCIIPKKNAHHVKDPDEQYFDQIAKAIEEKLKEFNISSNVINVLKGPVVDTFELELGAGVKVAGVTNRTDDLSLALMGAPIRMVYPMKGKSTIGIEVPRNPRDVIYLDEVLKSPNYNNSSYRLPIAMGKDAYGEAAIMDLAATPHLLVAGTTGAGKSVFINTLLVSLIIKFSPKKLRLIMLDPKQLELAPYQKLPHLIMPIVTDPQIASVALIWAIEEMERRYTLLKDYGVKNIEGFNKKVKTADEVLKAKITKYYPDVDKTDFELPYLVVVVDEFADLMLSKSGKAIETSISRLAAKARASGIHIVLATQRPSTDIITGVIKANFPTRVSFRVFTNIDSRVILDGVGAEKLLGKGDMLVKQGIDILRMHSAYVEEEEIESLVEKLSSIPFEYDIGAMEFIQNNGIVDDDVDGITVDGEGNGLRDEKFEEAVRIVATHRMASASSLQRRLGVGYNRAANLIEEMERQGIVGPAQGSKPRKVLIPPPSDSTP